MTYQEIYLLTCLPNLSPIVDVLAARRELTTMSDMEFGDWEDYKRHCAIGHINPFDDYE